MRLETGDIKDIIAAMQLLLKGRKDVVADHDIPEVSMPTWLNDLCERNGSSIYNLTFSEIQSLLDEYQLNKRLSKKKVVVDLEDFNSISFYVLVVGDTRHSAVTSLNFL